MQEKIVKALQWRYAVQSFDPVEKIGEPDLRTILESGRFAPSSFGLEPWQFIVVENSAVREKLRAVSYGQPKVTESSHLVVMARRTDTRENIVRERIERTAKIQNQELASLDGFKGMLDGVIASRDDAALDTWNSRQVYIALGMMMETASLLGIDNAAMEGFDDPKGVDDILGLSEKQLTATVLLAFGYRGEDIAASRPKVRRAFDEVVSFVK
ncbi:MAG: NAD(P)H-dependent oxidoreductase [Candidatus Moraniibacteriota bacterium]